MKCSNCDAPLQAVRLSGHYGKTVTLDLCAPCHLVWFDSVESAQLSGPGLLTLIGEMAAAQSLAHHPLRTRLSCAHCNTEVRPVHNQTRWGRSLQLECPERHGAWQTFGQFLQERGLLRPMSSSDRVRLRQDTAGLGCIGCGGLIEKNDPVCPWCGSPPAVVDVARLAQALDPEGATRGHAVHGTAARRSALQCQACGAPSPAHITSRCEQCGATLTASGLAQAHQAVLALQAALAAHATKPAPHVVQQRLKALQPGMDRERQRAADMQAEVDQRMGRTAQGWPGDVDTDTAKQLSWVSALPRWVWALGGLAFLIWMLWSG